ncbi:MAG: AMP-binding protein [Hyphomicrobiales bacterium]|nr:AMP-binding protein [Hyphomicrobiales bacterium]MCP5372976.1 AMP-binding protein [Hyphomicrobiales bacterium]
MDTFVRDHLPPADLWPEIDLSQPPEVAAYPARLNAAVELVDRAVDSHGWGDRVAIRYGDTAWTYAELKRRTDAVARALVEDMGLEPGQRVLLRGPNNPGMAAMWLGIAKAGGVIVATMPLLRGRELAYMVDRVRITIGLCDIDLADEARRAQELAPMLERLEFFSATCDEPGRASFDARMAGQAEGFAAVDTAADDVALVAFTSGTTGQPKGTVHFHRDILAMCDCFPRYTYRGAPEDVYVGTPPIAFTFGLGAQLCFPLRFGSSVVYYPGPPSPDLLIDMIRRHGCTTLYTAPTMYRALADKIAAEGIDLPSLTRCVSAGETLPLPTFTAFEAATGLRIIDGIGSTEMIHIFISAADDEIRPGATGKAIPGYRACIMDEAGAVLTPPCEGLLAVKGPTGCKYFDNEDRQRAYVRDGWNLPGDRYRQDADGYFWYVARADDMIISAGYNIGGPEVEAVLLDHPAVAECAVIGAPDPERGSIVKAFVVLRDPGAASDAMARVLQDFVKSQIAPYKYPRAVEFRDSLPKTQTGKLQRFVLRREEESKDQ